MTPIDLHSKTRKELSKMARDRSIQRWHSMKKQDLINAIIAINKKENPTSSPDHNGNKTNHSNNGKRWNSPQRKQITPQVTKVNQSKTHSKLAGGGKVDELLLQVASPSWVNIKWTLTTDILQRASASLGNKWYSAKPVLRIYEISNDNSTSENILKHEIEIHGNANHWYVYIDHVPATIVAHIGYLSEQGKFYILAKSARIEIKQSIIKNESTAESMYISPLDDESDSTESDFKLDAELLLKGSAHPNAEIELEGDIIKADDQGLFEFRMELPNGRQVIPAVMIAPDGEARRTIVLGVERSTKELEPELLSES